MDSSNQGFPSFSTGLTPQQSPMMSPAIPNFGLGATPLMPPSNSSFYPPPTPGGPMTPISPATPASEGSGIIPQLQNIVCTVNLGCKLDLKKIALHARNAEYNPKRFAAVIMRIRDPRTTALIFSSGKMVCTGAKREVMILNDMQDTITEPTRVTDHSVTQLDPIIISPTIDLFHSVVISVDADLMQIQLHLVQYILSVHMTDTAELFPNVNEELAKLAARKYARIVQKLGFPAKFMDFKIQNMVGSCDVKFPIRLEGLVLTHGKFSSYEPELFPGLIYRMMKPRIVLLIFVSGKVVLTGAKVRSEIYEAFENIYPILKGFKKQ